MWKCLGKPPTTLGPKRPKSIDFLDSVLVRAIAWKEMGVVMGLEKKFPL